jgi:outer membrane protein assembly factor BamB
LESKWPVVGGVLVYEGLAYFGVGRHADSDGGITVCAVEPGTGKLVWTEHAKDYQGIPDVLAGADGAIQMASYRFDAKTGESHDAREALLRGGRLGILNDAWYQRPIAMRKNLQQWQATGQASAQMMAYHPQATCGFLACESVAGSDGKMSGDAKLFVRSAKGREDWSLKMPNKARLRGMAITPDRAYVAGLLPAQNGKSLDYVVQAYSLADGSLLNETKIGSQPVHDGLAIADGRVYVSLQDGRLICLGEK